jgi:hypothetical protein
MPGMMGDSFLIPSTERWQKRPRTFDSRENCLTREAKALGIAPEGAMLRPSVAVRFRHDSALSAIDEAMADAEKGGGSRVRDGRHS